MRVRKWYWLPNGDNEGRGWWDCGVGEWSVIIGGINGEPVPKTHTGPWVPRVQWGASIVEEIKGVPCKTLEKAKSQGLKMARARLWRITQKLETLK